MTLQEMASAIRNNVSGGLREVYNHSYSIPQLEDEIVQTRAQIVLENSEAGVLTPDYFMQRQDNLALDLVRFPYGGYSNSPDRVLHVKIPRLAMTADNSSLSYFGPPDFSVDFKKYFDSTFNTHRYSRVINKRPYIFVDLAVDDDGNHDVYLFNVEGNDLKKISIRGIFANPTAIMTDQGLFSEDQEFPAPPAIQEMIIDRLVGKYVEYYRKQNMGYQPNTQTDTK